MIITYILNGLVLVAAVTLAVVYTRAYMQAPPESTWYSKLWNALCRSWTVTWGAFVVVGTQALDTTGTLADYLNAGAGDQLKALVPAQYMAAFTMFITVVFILARLRTMFK
jgi:hypothetical protein